MALVVVALAPLPAGAQQTFKCTAPDGKVTYQAAPCSAAGSQRTVNTNAAKPTPEHGSSAHGRALDAAVKRAIASGDLRHARELAVTSRHWQWINEAVSADTAKKDELARKQGEEREAQQKQNEQKAQEAQQRARDECRWQQEAYDRSVACHALVNDPGSPRATQVCGSVLPPSSPCR